MNFKFCEIQPVLWFAFFIVMAVDAFADPVPTPVRPNIIIILVDDMGYSDTEPYGSEIKTPHLMKLAESGLRFTGFHNCSKCSPSRGALMTGLYPQQSGMASLPKAGMNPKAEEDGAGELDPQAVTIAEVLKSAGYATAMAGKWHLTSQDKGTIPDAAKFGWPQQRGFDHFFGFLGGVTKYFDCGSLIRDNTPMAAPAGSYTTDLFAEEASTFILDHAKRKSDTPFFIYLAFNAPHWGLMAKEEDIAMYKGVYEIGWDALREQRLAQMKKLGVIPPACLLSPRNEEVPAWERLTPKEKSDNALAMMVYAGVITGIDRGVGRVLAALDESKQRDNTLVIFLSDNGASAEGTTGTKSGKEGHLTARIGPGWANVANTPFRYFKNSTWEGGNATELILNWPQGIAKSQQGTITNDVGHLIDLMPTCVELAKANYPKTFKERTIAPMEGRSLVPTFKGTSLGSRELFWRYGSNDSVRVGSWKMTRKDNKGHSEEWMLFDLAQDPSELHDVAQGHPEVVKELSVKWQAWAERVHAMDENGEKSEKKKEKNKKTNE